jgi:hypothetical protein
VSIATGSSAASCGTDDRPGEASAIMELAADIVMAAALLSSAGGDD